MHIFVLMEVLMNKKKFENQRDRYQNFLKTINCCPLCSSPLVLIHEFYKENHLVKETARCDECEIQTRRKDHICH